MILNSALHMEMCALYAVESSWFGDLEVGNLYLPNLKRLFLIGFFLKIFINNSVCATYLLSAYLPQDTSQILTSFHSGKELLLNGARIYILILFQNLAFLCDENISVAIDTLYQYKDKMLQLPNPNPPNTLGRT